MRGIAFDLRYSWRRLRKTPLASGLAAGSLAVGIGAVTLAWSLLDAVALRPPPALREPERLFAVLQFTAQSGRWQTRRLHRQLVDMLAETHDLMQIAGYEGLYVSLLGDDGAPDRRPAIAVSPEYFAVLGVAPALGALIDADSTPDSAVLGFDLWQRRFHGSPDALGARLDLGGELFTVIGVAPRGFLGVDRVSDRPELFVPIEAFGRLSRVTGPLLPGRTLAEHQRGMPMVRIVGRLAPGIPVEHAEAAIASRLDRPPPEGMPARTTRLLPLPAIAYGLDQRDRMLRYPVVLFGGLALVLLAACFNLANLFAARHLERDAELLLRSSLGAGRAALARLLLLEATTLVAIGTAGGIALAAVGVPLLVRLRLPVLASIEPGLGVRALAVAVGCAFVVASLVGVLPALRSSRRGGTRWMRRGPGAVRGPGAALGDGLLMAQVAVAVPIVVAAGLLVETSRNLERVDPGFDPANVLVGWIDLDPRGRGVDRAEARAFFAELRERLEALPGVVSVTAANSGDPLGGAQVNLRIAVPGTPDETPLNARHALIGTGYFETLGIPLVRGRGFRYQEDADGEAVVVVNEEFARSFWPGDEPLGRTVELGIGADRRPFRVIGVAADAKDRTLRDPSPWFVYLYEEQDEHWMDPFGLWTAVRTIFLRTEGNAMASAPALREIVRSLDPHLPLSDTTTLERRLREARAVEAQAAALFSGLGSIAVLVAVAGVYSLSRYRARRRRVEVGLRMALGAAPRQIFWLLAHRSLVAAAIGCVAGLAIAVSGSTLLRAYLFEVSPLDLSTFVAAALLLVAVTAVACGAPAREGARTDPALALRDE